MKKEIKEKIRKYILSKITDDIPDCSIKLKTDVLNEILFENTISCKKIALLLDDIKYENTISCKRITLPNSVMRKLDLSDISFDDVLIRGVDFTNTNATIFPRRVFNKDMRYGKYPLDFTWKSFNGVDVRGADFTGATNVHMDPQKVYHKSLKNGKYPVDFKDISFEDVDVRGADFNGATNVDLDPQTIYKKDMRWGKYPLDFTGKSFEDVDVRGADFTEATNRKIYDDIDETNEIKKHIDKALDIELRRYLLNQITDDIPDCSIKIETDLLNEILFENGIYNKKGMHCKYIAIADELLRKLDLSEVDFKDVVVRAIDFTGTNANIDPQTVYDKDMSHGKYPLDFTGKSFDGVNIEGSDFTGATKIYNNINILKEHIDKALERKRKNDII